VLDRGYTYFRELRKAEVRRIPLPRTPVNKASLREASLSGIMLMVSTHYRERRVGKEENF
jgi:hypothetical protein